MTVIPLPSSTLSYPRHLLRASTKSWTYFYFFLFKFLLLLLLCEPLGLTRAPYMGEDKKRSAGTWATLQWLHHWRQWLLPWQFMSTFSSSQWVPADLSPSMTEYLSFLVKAQAENCNGCAFLPCRGYTLVPSLSRGIQLLSSMKLFIDSMSMQRGASLM